MIITERVDYGRLGREIISHDVCAKKKNEKTFEKRLAREMVACAQSICEGRAQCMTRDELMRCAPEVSAQVECSSYICLIYLDTLFMFAVSLIWRTRPHFLICGCRHLQAVVPCTKWFKDFSVDED